MPLPTLMRIESETTQIKKLQEENSKLRQRLQMSLNQQMSASGQHQHQSRQQMFMDKKTRMGNVTNINEIVPFDIQPPSHLVSVFKLFLDNFRYSYISLGYF
jgi:valyl-tRNA synthetase